MTRDERLELIRQIEAKRGSRVLVYITGDRRNMETKISNDTFPFLAKHISNFNQPEKIDLFIYSTGGITMTGYSLVNMIREFSNNFGVLIPFKALSTATLIALGADDIIMTKMGQLSPIDPSVNHPLGPSVSVPGPANVSRVIPMNVEDMMNFVEFARTGLELNDVESKEKVFEILSNNIHPLVIGHGFRIREQTEFLANNLLSNGHPEEQRKEIIRTLTQGRYSHDYIISRREAIDLKLHIEIDEEIEGLIFSLFEQYQDMLELANPYSPEIAIGEEEQNTRSFDRAVIESDNLTHVFRTNRMYRRVLLPIANTEQTHSQVFEAIINEGWVEDNSI